MITPNDLDEAALEALDATPLDEEEAASGAERAGASAGETLTEVVERVVTELEGLGREPDPVGSEVFSAGGVAFAVHAEGVLEVALEGPVARAAVATPDTSPSPRGAGWVRFEPGVMDRYAADRAEGWLRYAHRRAAERAANR